MDFLSLPDALIYLILSFHLTTIAELGIASILNKRINSLTLEHKRILCANAARSFFTNESNLKQFSKLKSFYTSPITIYLKDPYIKRRASLKLFAREVLENQEYEHLKNLFITEQLVLEQVNCCQSR